MIAVRFLVAGRVQGVGFRAATRRQALALEVGGHARNLDDGRVEVLACGEREAIESLARWLKRGPLLARVSSVDREPAEAVPTTGFEVA